MKARGEQHIVESWKTEQGPVSAAGALGRAARRVLPPKQLGRRIQWLFLLMGLFNVVGALPRMFGTPGLSAAERVAACLATAFLVAWWVRGYCTLRMPAWALPIEGLAIAAIGIGQRDYVATLGMLFSVMSYRGLFGSWRHVVGFVVVAYAGSVSAVALTDAAHLGPFLVQSAGVPPLALFTALVALSTRRQERASARERVISQVGTTLATTADPEIIYRTATEAAHQMLACDHAWAAVSVPDGEGAQQITAFAGAAPAELAGAVFDPGLKPPELGSELLPLRTDKREYGFLIVYAGSPLIAEARTSLHALAGQTVLGLVNAENAADLRHQAFHDALTGLANRALLRESLEQAFERARRGAAQAVLLMDLDGFKGVNDTYGHALGDLLLVNVAQRLRDAVRGADTAARLGGDEFAVVLDSMESPDHALLVAQRILACVQAPLTIQGVVVTPRASIGIATWNGHHSAEAWMHEADTAMYAAKTAGKGCVGHLDEQRRPVIEAQARPMT